MGAVPLSASLIKKWNKANWKQSRCLLVRVCTLGWFLSGMYLLPVSPVLPMKQLGPSVASELDKSEDFTLLLNDSETGLHRVSYNHGGKQDPNQALGGQLRELDEKSAWEVSPWPLGMLPVCPQHSRSTRVDSGAASGVGSQRQAVPGPPGCPALQLAEALLR